MVTENSMHERECVSVCVGAQMLGYAPVLSDPAGDKQYVWMKTVFNLLKGFF